MATNNASNQRKPVNVSEGGTGASTLTSHGVLVGAGTGNITATAAGTANQVLQSGGAGADPAYSTATYPATASQGDIIYASASNTITGLAKDANATRYLSNQGTSNNPSWNQVNLTNGVTGALPIANGGTNASSMTNTYGVNYYDGSAIVTTAVGTAGHVLTSNGAGVAPTFQAAASGGITTLSSDSGTATGSTVTIAGTSNKISTSATGSTVTITIPNNPSLTGTTTSSTGFTATTGAITATAGNIVVTAGNITLPVSNTAQTQGIVTVGGTRWLSNLGTDNVFLGSNTGGYALTYDPGTQNVGIGTEALQNVGNSVNIANTGSYNVAVGYRALKGAGNGNISKNVAIGVQALVTASSNTGENVFIGYQAGTAMTNRPFQTVAIGSQAMAQMTGSDNNYNIAIGYRAGYSWTTSESSNVILGYSSGTVGDNNTMRLGVDGTGSGQQSKCYIGGCYGRGTAGTSSVFLTMNSDHQVTSSSTTATSYQTTIDLINNASAATANTINQKKQRGSGAITSGDTLGTHVWAGHDGTGFITASQIKSVNSGTVATNRIASNLEFYTHPDSTTASTQRMVISSTGAVTINSPDSGTGLTVSGGGLTVTAGGATITAGNFTVTNGDTTLVTSYGKTIGVSGIPVLIDNTGLLGTVASSERFKECIEDMGDESSIIMDLRPVTFSYKKDQEGTMQYGLIAEEVYDILPNLVSLDDEGIPYTVKYHDLPVLLLNELQKLADRVVDLELKLAKLEKKGKA